MKQKYFKHGTAKFGRSYLKSIGEGKEAGFEFKGKKVFVGNFIHSSEASAWYTLMNKEITTFAKRYPVGEKYPSQWYSKFIQHHLYSTYYKFLDKKFSQHTRTYQSAVKKDLTKYKKLRKKWDRSELRPFYKKAA